MTEDTSSSEPMAKLYGPGPGEPPELHPSGDLAGLSTNDVEDRPVGALVGALAEGTTGLIRYLDVEITSPSRHVLVPIGHARIDRDAVPPRVRLRAATYDELLAIPEYSPDETVVDSGYQTEVLRAHGRLFYGSRYYAHPAYDHRGMFAGEHPIGGPARVPVDVPRLPPLSSLDDYRVARGEADIRGWPLEGSDGERVGEVGELLVEVAAKKVRYVVIDMEEPERTTVVPVGYVRIDAEGKRTFTPALSRDDIRVLPAYEPPMTREDENRLLASIEGRLQGDRFFERPDFRTG